METDCWNKRYWKLFFKEILTLGVNNFLKGKGGERNRGKNITLSKRTKEKEFRVRYEKKQHKALFMLITLIRLICVTEQLLFCNYFYNKAFSLLL